VRVCVYVWTGCIESETDRSNESPHGMNVWMCCMALPINELMHVGHCDLIINIHPSSAFRQSTLLLFLPPHHHDGLLPRGLRAPHSVHPMEGTDTHIILTYTNSAPAAAHPYNKIDHQAPTYIHNHLVFVHCLCALFPLSCACMQSTYLDTRKRRRTTKALTLKR